MKKIKTIKPFFHNLVAGKVNEITVDLDFSVKINERIGISDYVESEDSCVGFTSDFIIEKIIINENNKVLKLKRAL